MRYYHQPSALIGSFKYIGEIEICKCHNHNVICYIKLIMRNALHAIRRDKRIKTNAAIYSDAFHVIPMRFNRCKVAVIDY